MEKQMKNKIAEWAAIGMLASLSMVSNSFAQIESSGTRGGQGGQITIDVNGIPVLRDIIDHCVDLSAKQWMDQVPMVSSIIQELSKSNWYFADVIKREAEFLSVCITNTPLKRIKTDDQSGQAGLKFFLDANNLQVGVRFNNQILVDGNLFKRMKPKHQALLVLHEIMHSFIPDVIEDRDGKVRNVIAAIDRNFQNHAKNPEELNYSMNVNDVTLPSSTVVLDGVREELNRVLDTSQTKEIRLAALYEIDDKISLEKLSYYLWIGDNWVIQKLISKSFSKAFSAIKNNDLAGLEQEVAKGLRSTLSLDGDSLLSQAAAYGTKDMVMTLIPYVGKTTSGTSKEAFTKILERMINGTMMSMNADQIIQLGADVNAMISTYDSQGKNHYVSMFSAAILKQRGDLVRVMLESKKIISEQMLKAAELTVQLSSKTAQDALVFIMKSGMVRVDQTLSGGGTLLGRATQKLNVQALKTLLSNGSNANTVQDNAGSTPMMSIVTQNSSAALETLGVLIAVPSIDVNARNSDQWTAFDIAANAENWKMAALVSAHPSFDPNTLTSKHSPFAEESGAGQTKRVAALNQFVDQGYAPLVKALLSANFRFSWFDLYRAHETALTTYQRNDIAEIIAPYLKRGEK